MLRIPSSRAILSSRSVDAWELPVSHQRGLRKNSRAPPGLRASHRAGLSAARRHWELRAEPLPAGPARRPSGICCLLLYASFQRTWSAMTVAKGSALRKWYLSHLGPLGLCCHLSSSVCPPLTWLPPTRARGLWRSPEGSYLEGPSVVFFLIALSVLFEGN